MKEQLKIEAINKFCPRSGEEISSDSLTKYKGFTVGFCNPDCRNDFQNNMDNCPKDKDYFDVIIKEKALQSN